VFLAKTLAWFFLLPIKFFYDLAKGTVMKIIVSLYKSWRLIKKYLLASIQAKKLGTDKGSLSIPNFIIILTVLVLVFNIQSRVQVRDFASGSLLDKLFNQVEELTVIESVLAQDNFATPVEQLAAIETNTNQLASLTTTTQDFQELQPDALSNGALIRPNIATTQVVPRDQVVDYVVEPGDTISNIAEKHGISTATILWANNLSDHTVIRPGEKLKILPTSGILHVVKSGETLSVIAKKYDVEAAEIAEANELVSEHQLQVSQALIVPGGKPPVTQTRTTSLASFDKIFSSAPSSPSGSGFIWPTPSRRITQYYWLRHKALDVGGSSNSTIVASKAGRVEYSGWSNGYGYNIVLNHGGNVKTRYAHMRQLWVKAGQQVQQGEGLGKKGTTGRSTGVHLHFEIIINGKAVNPLSYL
jgi:LysM repeat protein